MPPSDSSNVVSYLKEQGYQGFGVNRSSISYNSGSYMDIIKERSSFAPNSNKYKQIGVSVIYDSGILKIVVAYQ